MIEQRGSEAHLAILCDSHDVGAPPQQLPDSRHGPLDHLRSRNRIVSMYPIRRADAYADKYAKSYMCVHMSDITT
jgi:hypothetical protein